MKRLTATILALSLCSQTALADCDFSKEIEKLPDGRFAYSSQCHKAVGKMVQDLEDREAQVAEQRKTINLKDLMVTKEHERAQLWMDTSFKVEDRLNSLEKMKRDNELLYFFLGVGLTGLSVWGAGQLK
jgi:hypothetical protein